MKTLYLYRKNEQNKIIEIHEATEENLEVFEGYLQVQLEDFQIESILWKFAEITEFKRLLLETDWKVVVNSELVQAGLQIKYTDVHENRQAWRDGINRLEEEIILATNS